MMADDKLLADVLAWAESRCPCADGEPDPCSLCGARSEHDYCMAADATFPGALLARIRREVGSGTVAVGEASGSTGRSAAQDQPSPDLE